MLSHHTQTMEHAQQQESTFHPLSDKWCLWLHEPHETDWSLSSYTHVATIGTVEEAIAITETLPEDLVKNSMLFLMRKGIKPMWEDPQNRDGGAFSYKVTNKDVCVAWKGLSYSVLGGSVSDVSSFINCVTGITISSKKKFCIIKIWMRNCTHQNPNVVIPIRGLEAHGCIFKKHTPEF